MHEWICPNCHSPKMSSVCVFGHGWKIPNYLHNYVYYFHCLDCEYDTPRREKFESALKFVQKTEIQLNLFQIPVFSSKVQDDK